MKKTLFLVLIFFVGILNAQWSSDASMNNAICDLGGEQAIPKAVNGPTGDTYIGFFSNDSGNYDVRLQRLDENGNELWDHNGILISNNTAMSWLTDWDMTVDNDNHAILIFQDIRNGNNNIYAYRIAPDGTFIWGVDGLTLSNTTAFSSSPKVCVTSNGNAVAAWQEETISIIQKITPDGTLLWGTSGITISSANSITWPQPFAVDNDEVLVKYFDDSGPSYAPTRHCFMQKFDTNGDPVWTDPTTVTNVPGISAWTQVFNIISDGNNGCFITWHDSRGGGTISYPFVQHVLNDGSVGFTTNGLQLSSETNRQNFYPESVYFDITNELITYWKQTDGDQNNHGITGQKVDVATGNLVWGNNGNNLIAITSDYYQFVGARKAEENVMLILEHYTNSLDAYVVAAKIDQDGNYIWPEEQVTMCSIASEKVHTVVSQLFGTQFISAWEDDRNGAKDIYAQNINLDGTLGSTIVNGYIEGTVLLNGGAGNLQEVEVSAGTFITNPDVNGDFSLSLPAGTYDVNINLQYYTPANLPAIVVESGIVTTVDNIVLDWILVLNPPQNVSVNPNTGYISWDAPEPYPGTELLGYNIYLDGTFLGFSTDTFYQLENLINGMMYSVYIFAVYDLGESAFVTADFIYTGISAGNNLISKTEIIGNYPNPFNPNTTIKFSLRVESQVTLEVYNIKGEKVKTLIDGQLEAKLYEVNWNGVDDNNQSVSSGIYFYKMKAGKFVESKKMILMK